MTNSICEAGEPISEHAPCPRCGALSADECGADAVVASIFTYFRRELNADPLDDTLHDLPVDSPHNPSGGALQPRRTLFRGVPHAAR